MKPIPYGRQTISQEDIDAVSTSLQSDYLTQGPTISAFESAFSAYIGSQYAVAVSNGTAALHLSVLALGLKPGQKVLTSSLTFVASANCVQYAGAEVDFVDIDPKSYLISLELLEAKLASVPKGTYAGIIPVDFAGLAVDLEKLKEIAVKYNCWILEDSCHSPGGYFIDSKGEKQNCGNGNYADLAIFSFHPVKHIATGEGGMICTNNKALYEKLMSLRSHGISREETKFKNSIQEAGGNPGDLNYPAWYMEMQDLGYNYRLTDLQAALGLSQLKSAAKRLDKRKQIAETYYEAFKNEDFVCNLSPANPGHAYHLYVIQVSKRLELYNFLRSKNIFAQIHYFPCHLMPYYQEKGWRVGMLKNVEEYYKGCISLPMFPGLEEAEQQYVISSIKEFYQK
jgi:UDP-4-amino-4,6-dideoxy-N-acetyl-beta-L-altrosamine transaminase